MNTKHIYTVIVHSITGGEDSTCSFERYEDAVAYVNSELRDIGDEERDEIDCGDTIQSGDSEFTIYGARLIVAGDGGKAVYATIDSRVDGKGDEYTHTFASRSDAMLAASRDWGYLTPAERAVRTIVVAASQPTAEGGFDWGNYDIVEEYRA